MAVIEELLEAFKAQQQTIETLTVKLEETTAELEKAKARIAELEEQLHKDSHNSSKPPSTDGYEKPSPKSQRQKSGKRQVDRPGTRVIIWSSVKLIVLSRFIRSIAPIALIGKAVPILRYTIPAMLLTWKSKQQL